MATDPTHPTVFRLQGELDLARQCELDDIATMAAVQSQTAIVDMTEVTFLDSAALHWLLEMKMTLEEKNRRLTVVAPDGVVTRILSIAGLEGAIEVVPTRREALQSF